jgi:hypothetical protein
LKQTLFQTKFQ